MAIVGSAELQVTANIGDAISAINSLGDTLLNLNKIAAQTFSGISFDQFQSFLQNANFVPQNLISGLDQVQKSASGASGAISNTSSLLGGLTNGLQSATGFVSNLGGGMEGLLGTLGEVGGEFGAAAAAAIEFGIEVFQTAQKLFDAVTQFTAAGADLLVVTKQVQEQLGSFGDEAEKEAKRFANAWGLSETDFLRAVNNVAVGLKNAGASQSDAANQAVADTEHVIEVARALNIPITTALFALQQGIEGGARQFRALQAQMDVTNLRAILLAHGFQDVGKTLTDLQKQQAIGLLLQQEANDQSAEAKTGLEGQAGQLEVLHAKLQQATTDFKELLVPLVLPLVKGLADFADTLKKDEEHLAKWIHHSPEVKTFLKDMKSGFDTAGEAVRIITTLISEFVHGIEDFLKKHPLVRRALTDLAEAAIKPLSTVVHIAKEGWDDWSAGIHKLATDLGVADDQVDKHKKKVADTSAEQVKLNAAQEQWNKALKITADQVTTLHEAEDTFKDAQKEAAQSIADAKEKIKQASDDLAHTEEQNANHIADAVQAVADAQRQAADNNRNAQEKLADLETEHARKVVDLQARIAEAHKSSALAIAEAELAIEGAIRHGTGVQVNAAEAQLAKALEAQGKSGEAAKAQLDLQREQEDFTKNFKRDTQDLNETRLKGIEDVQKAETRLDRARKEAAFSNQQAQDKLTKAQEDYGKAVEAAADKIAKALKAEDAAFLKVAQDLGTTVADLKKLLADPILLEFLQRAQQPGGLFGGRFPGHMAGGPMSAGEFGIVGERGPELFVPRSNGEVITNELLRKLLRGGTGQNNITINEVAGDPEATAFAVAARLVQGVNLN